MNNYPKQTLNGPDHHEDRFRANSKDPNSLRRFVIANTLRPANCASKARVGTGTSYFFPSNVITIVIIASFELEFFETTIFRRKRPLFPALAL